MLPRALSLLTSWPRDRGAGSGTATFVDGFTASLAHHGVQVEPAPVPALPLDDYREQVAARDAVNAGWSTLPFPAGQSIVGLDWDGHRLTAEQRAGRQVIGSPRGLFADLVATEPLLHDVLVQQAAWEKEHLLKCDWLFVPSHYARQQVQHYYGVDDAKIAVIPNGIDAHWRDQLAGAQPFAWPHPTILAVAKFYPRKQIPLLVEAFALVAARTADIDLCIVGDGMEEALVRERVAHHGLESRVKMPGLVTDPAMLARYYASAICCCHPSIQETFGNVLLEALAAGKVIVAANAASLPEVAGEAGIYFEAGNAEALADALQMGVEALLGDPGLAAEMALRARMRAAQFTWEATARRFLNHWSEVAQDGVLNPATRAPWL
ncbi:MAG: glycosyltransferase family 1 protein [bacterium]